MKIAKIVAITLIVILLAILVGGFIFLKTLDVNKYIPAIAEQVKKSTGRELKIGRADLQLSFSQGIVLEVADVALSDDPRFSEKLFMSIDRIHLGLSLKPLIFERKIQIADVVIASPRITIIRNKAGQINAATMVQAVSASEGSAAKANPGKAMALPALLVDQMKVTDASVTYIDETFTPMIALTVDHLDLVLRGLSLTNIFSYDLKAALFSQGQNFDLTGKARIDLPSQSAWLTDARADLDLSLISAEALNGTLPMLTPAGIKGKLKGRLSFVVPELRISSGGIQELKFSGNLANGGLETSLVPFPLENIAIAFEADKKDLTFKSCELNLLGSLVKMSGVVRNYLAVPAIGFDGNVVDLELGKVTEIYKMPVKVTGATKVDFKLNLAGKTPDEMIASLKADVFASFKDGTIQGGSLLQIALAGIPIPGLWEMVQPSLPPETQEDLKKNVTVIESGDVLLRMNGMTASLERAEMVTRDIVASLKGTVQVPDAVNVRGDLLIQKKLADALVVKVTDMESLRVEQGRLRIPFRGTGPMLKPKFELDIEYLTKKLIAIHGQELLKNVIEKNPEVQGVLNSIFGAPQPDPQEEGAVPSPNGNDTSAKPSEAPEAESPASQAVGAVLDSLFRKKD